MHGYGSERMPNLSRTCPPALTLSAMPSSTSLSASTRGIRRAPPPPASRNHTSGVVLEAGRSAEGWIGRVAGAAITRRPGPTAVCSAQSNPTGHRGARVPTAIRALWAGCRPASIGMPGREKSLARRRLRRPEGEGVYVQCSETWFVFLLPLRIFNLYPWSNYPISSIDSQHVVP
jgi:hypothetical protein